MAHHRTEEEGRAALSKGTRTAKVSTVRADGSPHIASMCFRLDGDSVVFSTGEESAKRRDLARDGRGSLCVDDDRPPYAFAVVQGYAELSTEPGELLRWATLIAHRYVDADAAEEFGRRNGVLGELVVRVRTTRWSRWPTWSADGRIAMPGRQPTESRSRAACTRPACSTVRIRTSFPDARSRASHSTTGVPRSEVEHPREVQLSVVRSVGEPVDGDDERNPPALEVVDGGEAVPEVSRVREHDRREGALVQLVPEKSEAVLSWRAEQVERQARVGGDMAEIHRYGRGGAPLRLVGAVGPGSAPLAQRLPPSTAGGFR